MKVLLYYNAEKLFKGAAVYIIIR